MRRIITLALLSCAAASQAQMPPPSTKPIPGGKYTIDKPHSSLSFRVSSRRVEVVDPSELRAHGDLTLRGITKALVLTARFNGGYASHPFDPAARVGFSAHGSFKRSDYGIASGIPQAGSRFGVGDDVQVVLETEFSGPPASVARN